MLAERMQHMMPQSQEQLTMAETVVNQGHQLTMPETAHSQGDRLTMPETEVNQRHQLTMPETEVNRGQQLVMAHNQWHQLTMSQTEFTVWHYRYWHVSPRRPEAQLQLREDGRVRLVTPNTDSGWMETWRTMPNGNLRIIFHYAGESATIRRMCEFYMPEDSGIWITDDVYPVVMQFSHQTRMRAPARQQPPRLPQATNTDEEFPDWFVALRLQRLREELELNVQP